MSLNNIKLKPKDYVKINIHFSPCAVLSRETSRCKHQHHCFHRRVSALDKDQVVTVEVTQTSGLVSGRHRGDEGYQCA